MADTCGQHRAAYLDRGNNGVVVLLTGREHSDLSDDMLMAVAIVELQKIGGGVGKIVIGEWVPDHWTQP